MLAHTHIQEIDPKNPKHPTRLPFVDPQREIEIKEMTEKWLQNMKVEIGMSPPYSFTVSWTRSRTVESQHLLVLGVGCRRAVGKAAVSQLNTVRPRAAA